jgi:hypothetical protein
MTAVKLQVRGKRVRRHLGRAWGGSDGGMGMCPAAAGLNSACIALLCLPAGYCGEGLRALCVCRPRPHRERQSALPSDYSSSPRSPPRPSPHKPNSARTESENLFLGLAHPAWRQAAARRQCAAGPPRLGWRPGSPLPELSCSRTPTPLPFLPPLHHPTPLFSCPSHPLLFYRQN